MTDEGPPPATSWSPAECGLRLGIETIGAASVRLKLHNVGDRPLEVLSHVLAAGETHLDWFTVLLDGHSGTRTLALLDERNRSAAVRVTLQSGAQLRHEVDVAAWAARAVNGGVALEPDTYRARARYSVPADHAAWSGQLEAGPVQLSP